MTITRTVNIDLWLDKPQGYERETQKIILRRGEHRPIELVARIMDDVNLDGCKATFRCQLPNDNYYMDTADINDKCLSVQLNSAITQAVGRCKVAYFTVRNSDGVVSTTESIDVSILNDVETTTELAENYLGNADKIVRQIETTQEKSDTLAADIEQKHKSVDGTIKSLISNEQKSKQIVEESTTRASTTAAAVKSIQEDKSTSSKLLDDIKQLESATQSNADSVEHLVRIANDKSQEIETSRQKAATSAEAAKAHEQDIAVKIKELEDVKQDVLNQQTKNNDDQAKNNKEQSANAPGLVYIGDYDAVGISGDLVEKSITQNKMTDELQKAILDKVFTSFVGGAAWCVALDVGKCRVKFNLYCDNGYLYKLYVFMNLNSTEKFKLEGHVKVRYEK